MGKTVKEFVRSCDSCQRSKSSKAKIGLLQPLPVPKEPWEDITKDFMTGLPQTDHRNDAIFAFVDRSTKYDHLIPTTSTIGAEGAARLYIDHIFWQDGLSKTIVTSLPSLSPSLSLSLAHSLACSLSASTPHAQYTKRFRAWFNSFLLLPTPVTDWTYGIVNGGNIHSYLVGTKRRVLHALVTLGDA